jgi:REP element-mobilizing transposase RayT
MNYHFVRTPRYRRKVIVGNVEERLKSLLKEKCKATLWSRSYFVSTHGHVSTQTIEKYIEEQQTRR